MRVRRTRTIAATSRTERSASQVARQAPSMRGTNSPARTIRATVPSGIGFPFSRAPPPAPPQGVQQKPSDLNDFVLLHPLTPLSTLEPFYTTERGTGGAEYPPGE